MPKAICPECSRKTFYDQFINSNAVQYHCYEAALVDEVGVDMHAYSSKEQELVKKEFNRMAEKITEFEARVDQYTNRRVDPCPHCQCNELLCGWPRDCSSEKG